MSWADAIAVVAVAIAFVFFVGFMEGKININIGGKK